MKILLPTFSLAVLTTAATAGEPLAALYVTDASTDTVWHVQDLNFDGDYNDAGEVVPFYDDSVGPFTLSNNNTIAQGPDGTIYLGDTSSDLVYTMRDTNLDGDAHDAGETVIFFDGNPPNNLANIDMSSVSDLVWNGGRLWGSNANNGGGGFDGVFWMQDMNDDGDANDLGEAGIYYDNIQASVGDTVPNALSFGNDGAIYYVEGGSTGVFAKGVYRLEDLDLSGTIDQPGEAAAFFLPTGVNNQFFWDVQLAADGAFYMADSGNELIWRFEDTNANDVIDSGESSVWWQGTSSLIWQLKCGRGNSIFACESQLPDRLLRFNDDDMSGSIDVGEVVEVYDDTVSATVIANPRGMIVDLTDGFGTSFCDASDGALATCACAQGDADTGCDSPIPAMQGGGTTGGIKLTVLSQSSNAGNGATVTGEGYPSGSTPTAIVIRDSTQEALPIIFGDGLRCVGTTSLTRLAATVATAGVSNHTFGHGTMAGTGTFYYQIWFRSTPTSFCDPVAAFNLSNGQTLNW